MRSRVLIPAVVAVAVVVGLVGVWLALRGSGPGAEGADANVGASATPGTPPATQCPGYAGPAERLTFPSTAADRHVLSGASTGPKDAPLLVILRPGCSSAICQWLPWADRISADTGAQAIVFDRRGIGATGGVFDPALEPADIQGAVAAAAGTATPDVVLIGSSLGSTSVQSAVGVLDPQPCATVLVSPVTAALSTPPENTWLVWETQGAAVNEVARTLVTRASTPSAVHTLPVASSQHSGVLIRNNPPVLNFLVQAVRSCAGER